MAAAVRDHNKWVAVTGISMVTPLGVTAEECWKNMVAGKSGIGYIKKFDAADCLTKIGGELPDEYDALARQEFSDADFLRFNPPTRLALYNTRRALLDAQLDPATVAADRAGVITGCSGSTHGDEAIVKAAIHANVASNEMINTVSAAIGLECGFRGPAFNVATACASGAFAIGSACDYIRYSGGDVCIAVGVDLMLVKDTVEGFNQLLALSEANDEPKKASRPFDKSRDGFVLSEGCCAVVLESYRHAIDRGARIHAVVSGHACTSEAFNIVAPEPEGRQMARTMQLALADSGVNPSSIGYVNAHGTSTPHNDLAETKAIKRVFGDRAYDLAVSSQKSMVGHSIGASGAIEFGVTALILYHGIITPTINYDNPDPECDLDYVPNEAREVNGLSGAVTNSFGFGGHNSSIVLERFPPA